MTQPRSARRFTLPFALSLMLAGSGSALQAAEQDPALGAGSAQYLRNCAVCHGPLAQGDGPLAEMLTRRPPDLTLLSVNNDGEFPFWRVYEVIDGRDMPLAHGTRDMPIYGNEWRGEGSGILGETLLRGRIMEIMLYLRSIQAP